MELRAFAETVVTSPALEDKLRPPPARLTDEIPGPQLRLSAPARSPDIAIHGHRRVKVPRRQGMHDPAQRARILHALANHELQAAELFAWAVLAFPDAPSTFRRGLVAILADEQRHFALYADRLAALGGRFGDQPVTGHFWNKVEHILTPLQFVCTMGLTFENANLDHAQDLAKAAREAGDLETAGVLEQVHDDEIRHVRFAWRHFMAMKPADQAPWDAYCANVQWPLGPTRARGADFDADARRAAGIDEAFVRRLGDTSPERPGGVPR